jgi:hypothetical protein
MQAEGLTVYANLRRLRLSTTRGTEMVVYYQKEWTKGTGETFICHLSNDAECILSYGYRLTECAWIIPGTIEA